MNPWYIIGEAVKSFKGVKIASCNLLRRRTVAVERFNVFVCPLVVDRSFFKKAYILFIERSFISMIVVNTIFFNPL